MRILTFLPKSLEKISKRCIFAPKKISKRCKIWQSKNWFDLYLEDLDTLFLYLSQHYRVRLHERKSLIILDEVQLCPRARAAIKFLVADGRYDYIETGSLVSIKKNTPEGQGYQPS